MNTTAKTLSALLLGAALVTPALAQGNNAAAANNNSAQAAPAAAPTTPVDTANTTTAANNSSQANDNNANASSTAPTQMAMNTTGNAADLSSVPDTEKKYSRATRAKDFRKEAQTTAELNQKESSMNGNSAQ